VCLNAEPWHVIDKSLYGLPGIAFGRALTAYLAAAITRPVRVDEPHVVIGWLQSASGRRSLVGSAIVTKHQPRGLRNCRSAVGRALALTGPPGMT
jgi:hypothetical protein